MPIDKNSCFCVVLRILWAFRGTMRFVLELAKKNLCQLEKKNRNQAQGDKQEINRYSVEIVRYKNMYSS